MPRISHGYEFDDLSRTIIGCAINVHRELGPGLLESAYHLCLVHELRAAGLRVESKVPVPLKFRDLVFDNVYEADVIVEGKILIELKAVLAMDNIFIAQTLTYIRLMNISIGLLINFHVELLKDGVKRLVL